MKHGQDPFSAFSPEAAEAWVNSGMGSISPEATRQLLETAVERSVPAGEILPFEIRDSGGPHGFPAVVVSGQVRIFAMYGSRQVTFQYVDAGDMFAIPEVYGTGSAGAMTAAGQTLCDSRILFLSPAVFGDLLARDGTVAHAGALALRRALVATIGLLAENVLQPLRQRVARHLLDLGVRQGDRIVVEATVKDIADATGTVREVVTRLFKQLREEGLIAREEGVLVILDPSALHRVAQGLE